MIYLLLTACLSPRSRYSDAADTRDGRLARYVSSIQETLRVVQESGIECQPLLVENSHLPEEGPTRFDSLGIPVLYTHALHDPDATWKNKGVYEWLDVLHAIRQYSISPRDIVIKLTGRYRLCSAVLLQAIQATASTADVWMKFYNVSTAQWDPKDCVMGLFAMRATYLSLLSPYEVNRHDSAEKAVAAYVRHMIPASRIHSMDSLGVECVFAEEKDQRPVLL